jgi:hypothetical protein
VRGMGYIIAIRPPTDKKNYNVPFSALPAPGADMMLECTSMRLRRIKISVSRMLFLVAVLAAYAGGFVSQRSQIEQKRKDLESLRKEWALGLEQAELANATRNISKTATPDLERIEALLDQLDAYEAAEVDGAAAESEP